MNLANEVPEFEVYEFLKKKHKYCVCIFIINEGERFLEQLSGMSYLGVKVDIVVADGDSIDGSTEHSRLMKHNVNTLLVKKSDGTLALV